MEPEGSHFPEAEFFGVRVPEGEIVVVGAVENEEDTIVETYHLTQVALGPSPASGRHTVYMETDGQQKVAIGTLQRDRVEQFQVDFMSQATVQISHTGGSDVFVSGFKVIAPIMEEEQRRETDSDDEPFTPEGHEDEDDEGEEDEEDTDEGVEEDDDEEEVEEGDPADVQAMKRHFKQEQLERQLPKPKKGAAPAAAAAAADEDDDDEGDDEEGGEDAAGEDGFGALRPQEFSDMDDDDDDEDDDEDEDDLERAMDDDEDDEEDEEGEDDEEEAAPALVSRPQAGKKRPAQATDDATPQPAKQAKAAGGGKQPNSQTPVAAAAGTPGSSSAAEQSWAKDIQAHLKKNGASKLAALGSNVPKPAGVPKTTKMKKFLENRPDLFTVDPNTQLVTLKQ